MNIIFYHPSADFQKWQVSFENKLPGLNLVDYKTNSDLAYSLAETFEYACVWAPPIDMLRQFKNLKGIFVLGAGVDALLSKASEDSEYLPKDVPIMRIEDGGMAVQMIEYALSRVYHYFRRFDVYEQQQQLNQWKPVSSFDYDEFCIGVLGTGILGQAVARTLIHQGFKVKTYSRTPKVIEGADHYHGKDNLPDFLAGVKLIINLLPNTQETVGLINRSLLSQLDGGCFLINLARGVHLVEQDLLDLIDEGHVAGASLDVFCQEPLDNNHPFWQNKKIFITPHIAAVTKIEDAVNQITLNIKSLIEAKQVTGLVDRVLGY